MSQELSSNQAPSGMQPDNSSDVVSLDASPDPDLIAQTHRLAGQQHLGQLFQAGILDHKDDPEQDIAATLASYPDFSKKDSTSALKAAASEKLEKRLHKLLEDLGQNPPISDKKGASKLISKAQMHLMKMPGFPKLKADDKTRVVHRILKLAAGGDLSGLHDIIEHENKHVKAKTAVANKVLGLFSGSYPKETPVDESERERIRAYIDGNGLDSEIGATGNYAEGGEVHKPLVKDRVAQAFPNQAAILAGHKTRIYNHLNSLKPRAPIGMPFDHNPPTPDKDREYRHAVDMAARPLSILDHVQDGSISPAQLKNFAAMHPELHDLLKKRITMGITKMQAHNGEKPPFHVRQALSAFMAQPMEQAMTPASIMAAQATFVQQPPGPQQQPQKKSKGAASKLGKSNAMAMTPLQADAARHSEKP